MCYSDPDHPSKKNNLGLDLARMVFANISFKGTDCLVSYEWKGHEQAIVFPAFIITPVSSVAKYHWGK